MSKWNHGNKVAPISQTQTRLTVDMHVMEVKEKKMVREKEIGGMHNPNVFCLTLQELTVNPNNLQCSVNPIQLVECVLPDTSRTRKSRLVLEERRENREFTASKISLSLSQILHLMYCL